MTFFNFVALKDRLNISPNLTRLVKTVLKIDSCSGWACTSCPGGACTHFPVNYAWKKFFHGPGGAGAPTAPPPITYIKVRYDRNRHFFLTPTFICNLIDLFRKIRDSKINSFRKTKQRWRLWENQLRHSRLSVCLSFLWFLSVCADYLFIYLFIKNRWLVTQ